MPDDIEPTNVALPEEAKKVEPAEAVESPEPTNLEITPEAFEKRSRLVLDVFEGNSTFPSAADASTEANASIHLNPETVKAIANEGFPTEYDSVALEIQELGREASADVKSIIREDGENITAETELPEIPDTPETEVQQTAETPTVEAPEVTPTEVPEISQEQEVSETPEITTPEISRDSLMQALEISEEPETQTQEKSKEAENPNEEEKQRELMAAAKKLIESNGGEIDPNAGPYKQFDQKLYERFLVQKGKLNGVDVVFKIGEISNENAMQAIQNESRNMHIVEGASTKSGEKLDMHFVGQVGNIFEDGKMRGLATEYIQDDSELKRSLSAEQKAEVTRRTIENLQRLNVTDEVLESGLPMFDGKRIVSDSIDFVGVLEKDKIIDSDYAKKIRGMFNDDARLSLGSERPVFTHGDAHSDNFFIKKNDKGGLDISLLDLEGLRISNEYYDWSLLMNKAAFLKRFKGIHPELAEKIKDMWLDESAINEQQLVQKITGGDSKRAKNFQLTKIHSLLVRIMECKNPESPFAKDRLKISLEQLQEETAENKSEHLPTIEEVLAIIGISPEDCVEPPKELSGGGGFEIRIEGENEGEVIEYMYRRKGEFSTHKSSGTSIHETVYDKDGDFIKYPEHIAEYDSVSGEWKNVR